jgi:hypothetical protein
LPNLRRIPDVGRGAGDNARVIRKANKNIEIVGITLSEEESKHARRHMAAVHVVDLDVSDLSFLGELRCVPMPVGKVEFEKVRANRRGG